jgi:tetratricopeptide (TPR) repeat protein
LLYQELAEFDERATAMAEKMFTQTVEVNAEHAAGWLELGLMMAQQDRGMEAITALEEALESDPAATAMHAVGPLCAMYAANDEGFRGVDFFEEQYAANPEVSALGVGSAMMLDCLGDRDAALSQARDIMLIEEAGTPEHAYATKLIAEWEGEKP